MEKGKTGLKIVLFLAILTALFVGITRLVQPIWPDWNTHNATHGFYEEPENTIETFFLGSSAASVGVIPMQLYEDYGICAYNAGTESQPLMASYYWAEEAYRLHSETLDTIVLDVSMLRKEALDSMYIKVLDAMKLSKAKLQFMRDFSKDFPDYLSHLFPVISYHDRWKELSEQDFKQYELATYSRGYYFVTDNRLEKTDNYMDIAVPLFAVEDTGETTIDEEPMTYLTKLIELCDEHDIRLVLIKTPQDDWTDEDHNTVQAISEENQLDFFDFNYEPYLDEIDYNGALDRKDNMHLTYPGAVKLTDWLGQYLTEECGNRDVRGEEKYAFMEDELEDFHREIASISLAEIADPAEYLSYLTEQEDLAVFISAKEEAAGSLTDEQREIFEELGLTELSELSDFESYLAVIDDGTVMEWSQVYDQDYIDEVNADETGETPLYISCEGKLSDGTSYFMTSGSYYMGNVASIQIEGEEYSPYKRGLDIVVYDKKLNTVTDRTSFDTYEAPVRDVRSLQEQMEDTIRDEGESALTDKLLELYQYESMYETAKEAKLSAQ